MRNCMVDEGVIIYMLLLIGNDTAIKIALCTFSTESKRGGVASYSVMKCDDMVCESAIRSLVEISVTYTFVVVTGFFHAIKIERCILAYVCFYHLCSKIIAVVSCVIAEQHLYFGSWFYNYQHTSVEH